MCALVTYYTWTMVILLWTILYVPQLVLQMCTLVNCHMSTGYVLCVHMDTYNTCTLVMYVHTGHTICVQCLCIRCAHWSYILCILILQMNTLVKQYTGYVLGVHIDTYYTCTQVMYVHTGHIILVQWLYIRCAHWSCIVGTVILQMKTVVNKYTGYLLGVHIDIYVHTNHVCAHWPYYTCAMVV